MIPIGNVWKKVGPGWDGGGGELVIVTVLKDNQVFYRRSYWHFENNWREDIFIRKFRMVKE